MFLWLLWNIFLNWPEHNETQQKDVNLQNKSTGAEACAHEGHRQALERTDGAVPWLTGERVKLSYWTGKHWPGLNKLTLNWTPTGLDQRHQRFKGWRSDGVVGLNSYEMLFKRSSQICFSISKIQGTVLSASLEKSRNLFLWEADTYMRSPDTSEKKALGARMKTCGEVPWTTCRPSRVLLFLGC